MSPSMPWLALGGWCRTEVGRRPVLVHEGCCGAGMAAVRCRWDCDDAVGAGVGDWSEDLVWWRLGDGPSGGCGPESERGEAGHVGGGGEQVEVGVDFGSAADSSAAAAVSSSHHVAEFAFDFGAGGPVVVFPLGALLALTGSGEGGFVDPDPDGAAAGCLGARLAQRAVGTRVAKVGDP